MTAPDTPRTDAAEERGGAYINDLARTPERDLAAAKAELSTYRQWAEVEIADLRDDVKRHIEIASFNAEEALKWRTMFQNERDHMNAAQEEIVRLRGKLEVAQAVTHLSHVRNDQLEAKCAELERELAAMGEKK